MGDAPVRDAPGAAQITLVSKSPEGACAYIDPRPGPPVAADLQPANVPSPNQRRVGARCSNERSFPLESVELKKT